MNGISPTMSLANKATGDAVDVGTPEGRNYNFQATKGTYVLTAYATDGTTNNGTIEINVTDEPEQSFMVFTNTAYATNTKGENVFWEADVDYTVEAEVNSREGVKQEITVGNSIMPGRKTFLALNGNSYYVTMTPSEEHQATAIISGAHTHFVYEAQDDRILFDKRQACSKEAAENRLSSGRREKRN